MCMLTLTERLQLHQLPLYRDTVLAQVYPGGQLLFEDSPSPEVYTSIFCQWWGTSGGGVVERNVVKDKEIVVVEELDVDRKIDVDRNIVKGGNRKMEVEGLEEVCGISPIFPSAFNFSAASARDTNGFMMVYTALSGPDTPSMPVELKEKDNFTSWELDIDFIMGKDDNT